MNLLLKAYDVSEEIFDEILKRYECLIETHKDITAYKWGYKNKNTIMYNGLDELIIKEMYLDLIYDLGSGITNWKQCIVRRAEQSTPVEQSITGTSATAYMNNILRKYYTDDEIEEALHAHESEYNPANAQYHYLYNANIGELLKFSNCVYYDINGAHLDALSEIFPRAKKDLLWLFKNRKKSAKYKKIPNFYVGNLCNKQHRLTYNWIVQRTNELLLEALIKVGGTLIYANTDGFIASRPDSKLDVSKELGKFKLEATGDVYLYQSNNYYALQYEDVKDGVTIKGSALCNIRNKLNLAQGKVIKYDRVKSGLTYEAKNIKEIKVKWQKA